MDVLVIEEDVLRPDTVVASFSAQTPSNVKLADNVVPDSVAAAWAAEAPTLSFSGTMTITPEPAQGGWFAGGEGTPVSPTGGVVTPADYVRGGFAPFVSLVGREPLFPPNTAVLVTGLKDSREPGKERRTITVEDF